MIFNHDLTVFLINWGPGFFILAGFYLLLNRSLNILPKLFENHSENISRQTDVLNELKNKLVDSQNTHSLEHREMILTLRYVAQKVESLDERFRSSEK